jgi:hypothetical protein
LQITPSTALAGRRFALALALTLAFGTAQAQAPTADEPVYVYEVVPGDSVIGLSRRLLVDPARWPEVARFNRLPNANRISPRQVLQIPLRLMQAEPEPATVQSVVGAVRGPGGAALANGQQLAEGGEIGTGDDGHITLRLVDGTVLRLRPASRLTLRESSRVRQAGALRSGARLEQGRVEIEATPAPAGKPGFRIDTPQGVLGVRGTEFRVTADTGANVTRGEVLSGVVAFEGRATQSSERVAGGFGSVIGASGQVAPPVKLLPAPSLAGLPTLQERILMRFPITVPLAGAAAYRAQISRDDTFDLVVADLTSATPELRFAELPDGDYVLRVRGLDALGLEGANVDHRFRLKARPEAPLPQAPAPRAVSFGPKMDFAWAANEQAQRYRLQLAADAGFASPLRDVKDLQGLATTLDGLPPGVWHWRLASIRRDAQGAQDQGPWGDPRSFELRPLPPEPAPPKVGDKSVRFDWEGRPGQTFEFELARSAAFSPLLLKRELAAPGLELPHLGTGRFYVRLRARDPDGFIGPYTTPQYFDVPNCVRNSAGDCWRMGGSVLELPSR